MGQSTHRGEVRLRLTEVDWERIERDTMAWWAGELDRPLVWLTATEPGVGVGAPRYLSNYPRQMPVQAVLDQHEPVLAATRYYADALPCWWVNFGPGIMAGFLGSRVNSVTEPSETVWFSPAAEVDVEDLVLDYDADNRWWQRVRSFTAAMVDKWDGRLAVGHTDLGGNLDILASFCSTEGLLFSLLDHPEVIERLAQRVTELWLQFYDELDGIIRSRCRGTTCWAPIWSTGKTYMLQSDFSYMISPKMFERFVLPDLAACCAHLDHGFYHLDGKGQIAHLDMLLSLPRLRGIQWVPGDGQLPPDRWLALLKRIRQAGKLCQVFVRPEGALDIVKNLGGRGFLLAIAHSDPRFIEPEYAGSFLRTLAQEDISPQGY